jgi:glycosyltransferase involved in cell wall biosynthesis
VLLEAMLLGKPLVSTTTGGPAEVVNDGESGLLVEPGRPELLADAITRLLSDPAWAAALGARGRERLEREFASERTIAQTVAVYERVLAKRRVGGGTELRTH